MADVGFTDGLLMDRDPQSLRRSRVGWEEFTVTPAHLALLRRAQVRWSKPTSLGIGVPCIDPIRPYGDSSIEQNIAELADIPYDPDVLYGEGPESDVLRAKLLELHAETQTALQIALETAAFVAGRYVKVSRFHGWTLSDLTFEEVWKCD